ncbi:MAG: endolytic transglycosylase MltG [Anaerotignaceae bacterium]
MSKKRKKSSVALIVIAIVSIIVIIFTCFWAYSIFNMAFSSAKNATSSVQTQRNGTGEMVNITIPEGASTKKIGEILHENGLIDSVFMFRITSRLEEYDGTYKQGDYVIEKGLTDEEIMQQLQNGVVYANSVKITIPEGYTAKQIAKAFEEAGLCTAEEFINEMNNGSFDYEFLQGISEKEYRLEGFLFPATYEFKEGVTPNEIITKLLDRFLITYNRVLKDNTTGYTVEEVVTVASMVESEIQVDEERPIAAGVIYNRLNIDMLLQIDSTVQYAQSTRNEVVTYTDLQIDSPYNTYKYKGLPPGAICNPGDLAIEAAVQPAEHNYIYYVVKQRGSGEHVFCETYDEFLKAKAAYQSSFNN